MILDLTPTTYEPEGTYTREDMLRRFYSGETFLYHPFEQPVEGISVRDPQIKAGQVIQFRHYSFKPFFRIWLTPCINLHGKGECPVCGGWEWIPRYFNRKRAYHDKERTPFWQA